MVVVVVVVVETMALPVLSLPTMWAPIAPAALLYTQQRVGVTATMLTNLSLLK